jgi:hypothetical protein
MPGFSRHGWLEDTSTQFLFQTTGYGLAGNGRLMILQLAGFGSFFWVPYVVW